MVFFHVLYLTVDLLKRTNLNLTKLQMFTTNKTMNKKVVKGVSIFCLSLIMNLGLAFGGGSEKYNLYDLEELYSYCQGRAASWPRVLASTKEAVLAMLADEDYEPTNDDLMAIRAFCLNHRCIDRFMQSKFYEQTKHDECLKNLFRLSHKAACKCEMSQEESIKMEQYKILMDQQFENGKNLLSVITTAPFPELAELASGIIARNIDWGD